MAASRNQPGSMAKVWVNQTRGMKPAWMTRHHQGWRDRVAKSRAAPPMARLVSRHGMASPCRPKYGQARERTRMAAAPCSASCRIGGDDIPRFYAIKAFLAFSLRAPAWRAAASRTGPKPRTSDGQPARVRASADVPG